MPTSEHLFKGFNTLQVSPKGNVQLPRGWPDGLSGPFFIRQGQEYDVSCIQVIPVAILYERTRELDSMDRNAWKKHAEVRDVVSATCRTVTIGTRLSLTLPQDWSEEAGIAFPGNVVVAGRGRLFEFWSQENFNIVMARELLAPDEEDTVPEI